MISSVSFSSSTDGGIIFLDDFLVFGGKGFFWIFDPLFLGFLGFELLLLDFGGVFGLLRGFNDGVLSIALVAADPNPMEGNSCIFFGDLTATDGGDWGAAVLALNLDGGNCLFK